MVWKWKIKLANCLRARVADGEGAVISGPDAAAAAGLVVDVLAVMRRACTAVYRR